ncbi:MAG: hypothetical protein IPN72_21815 [Saprospiraceae bacterium]|nr:hypothetical protein [Saprospiraceae bacterium]
MPPTKNINDPQVLLYEAFPKLDTGSLKNRNFERDTPNQYDTKHEAKWAKDLKKGIDFTKVKLPLVLSAANTFVKDKGRLDVVSCSNIFPTNPTIEFVNDRTDHFGGEVSIWLEGLKGGELNAHIINITGKIQRVEVSHEIKYGRFYPKKKVIQLNIPCSNLMSQAA